MRVHATVSARSAQAHTWTIKYADKPGAHAHACSRATSSRHPHKRLSDASCALRLKHAHSHTHTYISLRMMCVSSERVLAWRHGNNCAIDGRARTRAPRPADVSARCFDAMFTIIERETTPSSSLLQHNGVIAYWV